ncbi:MAG: hypothetical protein K0S21_1212 [Rhizobiaceae bacterium]|nr:hypothetical protein [Rhizobiaceae bacterium]
MSGIRVGVAFVAGAFALSGCLTGGGVSVPSLSAGAAPGATAAVASGIIASMNGGLIGAAGARLERSERRPALEAEYRALEYMTAGQAVQWQGDDARRGGEVVAAQPYRVGSQDCRQYSHTFSLNGPRQTVRGTACRNPDGSWTPLT